MVASAHKPILIGPHERVDLSWQSCLMRSGVTQAGVCLQGLTHYQVLIYRGKTYYQLPSVAPYEDWWVEEDSGCMVRIDWSEWNKYNAL